MLTVHTILFFHDRGVNFDYLHICQERDQLRTANIVLGVHDKHFYSRVLSDQFATCCGYG